MYGKRYEIKSNQSVEHLEGVIEAYDAETRQLVDIKELPELEDEDDIADFLPQAEMVAKLKHQNLIRLMDSGVSSDNVVYLVFEKFKGTNLHSYIEENGPFSVDEGLSIAQKIIDGINYLHNKGIMHGSLSLLNVHPFRELKSLPLNIKISGLLDIYPNDLKDYDNEVLSAEPFYSPEQVEDEQIDFRSDIFSIGCLIYVLVTGKNIDLDSIYQASNAIELIKLVKDKSIPPTLESVIQKAIEVDPDVRFQNCGEMLGAIKAVQKFLPRLKKQQAEAKEEEPDEEADSIKEPTSDTVADGTQTDDDDYSVHEATSRSDDQEKGQESEAEDNQAAEHEVEGDTDAIYAEYPIESSSEEVDSGQEEDEDHEHGDEIDSISVEPELEAEEVPGSELDIEELLQLEESTELEIDKDTSEEPEPISELDESDSANETDEAVEFGEASKKINEAEEVSASKAGAFSEDTEEGPGSQAIDEEQTEYTEPIEQESVEGVSELNLEEDDQREYGLVSESEPEPESESEPELETETETEEVHDEEIVEEAKIDLAKLFSEDQEDAGDFDVESGTTSPEDDDSEDDIVVPGDSGESTEYVQSVESVESVESIQSIEAKELESDPNQKNNEIKSSGLHSLIDFKRASVEDSVSAIPEEAESFQSIAGAFRKSEKENSASNIPILEDLDFGKLSKSLFEPKETTKEELELDQEQKTESKTESKTEDKTPAIQSHPKLVELKLEESVEQISDSIGITRKELTPVQSSPKQKEVEDKEEEGKKPPKPQPLKAKVRRVASTMIAPAAQHNSYQKMVELGSSDIYTVYKAKETNTGTVVAAKTLKPLDDKVTEVFIKQARLHSSLLHENIVRSIGSLDTSLGRPFFIMDYIKGITLEDLLKSVGRIDTITEFTAIFTQTCKALEYAHGKGVLHGNLRPSNILLQEEEGNIVVKVLDFGMSEPRFENQKITNTAPTADYALYMSPEQFKSVDTTIKSDIYQLGTLGFKMLTGTEPVTGGTFSAVMNAKLEREAEMADITTYRHDLRNVATLNAILKKAMRANIDERFASVAELRNEVERWSTNRPTREIDRKERESNLRAIIQDQVKLRQTQYDQEGTLMMKFTTLASQGPRQSPIKATALLILQIVFVIVFSGYLIFNFSTVKKKFHQVSIQMSEQFFQKKVDPSNESDAELISEEEEKVNGSGQKPGSKASIKDKDSTGSNNKTARQPNPAFKGQHKSIRSTYVAPVHKRFVAPEKIGNQVIPRNQPVYPYLFTEEELKRRNQIYNMKDRSQATSPGASEIKTIK